MGKPEVVGGLEVEGDDERQGVLCGCCRLPRITDRSLGWVKQRDEMMRREEDLVICGFKQ